MTIEARNISFSYGARQALEQVSFRLQPGRLNALLGPNGAGKSTLFALLTRLYAMQQGELLVNGTSLNKQPASVMRQIGVVFQQTTLDLDLNVEQNLRYHAALHGLSGQHLEQRIATELERMQMAERRKDKVRNLNGGHRRRLEIARALLHQPSILLLDEATVGLDAATRKQINEHVRSLCTDQQLTVLWTTHLIEEISEDDPVILLHKGKVLAATSAAGLCQRSQQATLSDAFSYFTATENA